jgi:ubiquinone/menaquinone biosynthesis C-methylase UbiE
MTVVSGVADAANPAVVFEHMTAYQRSAALRTAIELDLFRAVGDVPADAPTLAERCGASARGVRILCDYLVTIGLLAKQDQAYIQTPTSAVFLDTRSPASLASTVRLLGHPDVVRPWERLTDIVRTGRTVLPGTGTVEPDNPLWVEFARSMVPMMAPALGPVADAVLGWTSGPITVLDIAAGHGMFGIEIARRNPAARVVALDWAAVLDVADENARAAGVQDRFERLVGSAFDVAYGGPYDAVLLTNFLHHFDAPTCTALLRKVRSALRADGVAVTLEFVPNDDRVSPTVPAQFGMMMLGTTAAGEAYTFRELERMHLEAGFSRMDPEPVAAGAEAVLVAHA